MSELKQLSDVQIEWINRLRSGKWRKGTGKLRHPESEGPDSYCCLGVAVDLVGYEFIRFDEYSWVAGPALRSSYLHSEVAYSVLGIRDQQAIARANDSSREENFDIPIRKIIEAWKAEGFDVSRVESS